MLRIAIVAALTLLALPAAAQTPAPRPIGVSTTGPWESVVWGVGQRVHRCTMIRDKQPAGEPSYGVLIDRQGMLFSVESDRWTLTAAPTPVEVKPASGRLRKLTAQPVSPQRANMDVSKDTSLLDDLQRSEHAEVRIGAVKLKLPFDDFNAARVVLEICVQQIGKNWQPAAR